MHFATATKATRPTQPALVAASLYLALFFVAVGVLQLFAFEDFPAIIRSYGIPFFSDYALSVAGVLVCLEVFALPWLLWMKVSPLMRRVSFASAWASILYWLAVGVWQSLADFPIANAGLFGAKVVVPQGWWLVSYSFLLLALMAIISFRPLTRLVQEDQSK